MSRKPISNKAEDNPTIHERLRHNSEDFAMTIEDMVRRRRIGYIEAIIEYCNDNELEFEMLKDLVRGALKSKLEAEAENLHFLPSKAKLPL